jgi:hypothetical protein
MIAARFDRALGHFAGELQVGFMAVEAELGQSGTQDGAMGG